MTGMTTTFTVRVTRPDGSVTFRGVRLSDRQARRERDAWLTAGGYAAEIVANGPSTAAECRVWTLATRNGGRYFPTAVTARLKAGAAIPIDPANDDHGPDCQCVWCDPDRDRGEVNDDVTR